MLRPQDNGARELKSLAGLWAFRLDPEGAGRDGRWFAGPLPDSRRMPVPASYNDVVPTDEYRKHVGGAWYQTTARVPERWRGERIVLRFDSATHRATVWVGDAEVVSHEGGYTPFEADVTEHVVPGGRSGSPPSSTTRSRGGRSFPGTSRRSPTGERPSSTSTTSSTTPACTARYTSTRRGRPT